MWVLKYYTKYQDLYTQAGLLCLELPSKVTLKNHEYYPEIDGLRAFAVTSVILYHLNEKLLPGGFVGVDVFFVISGYLIASIILREQESGKFSLRRFYQRRIARIAPLSFFVISLTLVCAWAFYSPQDYASAGTLAAASSFSLANMKLLLQGNYFELSPDAQPFMHFWSLAVEEQFYLVFPVLVVVLSRLTKSRSTQLFNIGILCVLSFACCLFLSYTKPNYAFYLLPTRAWEIATGVVLAYIATIYKLPTKYKSALVAIGLAISFICVIYINDSIVFPGYIAFFPVLGTVLVIIGIAETHESTREGLAYRFLRLKPLVAIGKISFSLYLLHWPVFCFIDYGWCFLSSETRNVAKVVATLCLAVAAYIVVEKPCRVILNQPAMQRIAFLGLFLGCVGFSLAGYEIRNRNYVDASLRSVANGGVAEIRSPNSPTIALIGDSNASMYGKTVLDISRQLGLNAHVISVAGQDPLPGSKLYNSTISFLENDKIDIAIVAAAWMDKAKRNPQLVDEFLREVSARSRLMIVLTQPPVFREAPRDFIRRTYRTNVPEDRSADNQHANNHVSTMAKQYGVVLDIYPFFHNDDDTVTLVNEKNQLLYHDGSHLSGYGSDLVKKELVEAIKVFLDNSVPKLSSTHGSAAEYIDIPRSF